MFIVMRYLQINEAEKLKEDFDIVKVDYKFLNRETGLKPIRLTPKKLGKEN